MNKYTFINICKQYIRIDSNTFQGYHIGNLRLFEILGKVKYFQLSGIRTSDHGITVEHSTPGPSVSDKLHSFLISIASQHLKSSRSGTSSGRTEISQPHLKGATNRPVTVLEDFQKTTKDFV